MIKFAVTLLVFLNSCAPPSEGIPVYGFSGAFSSLISGRILHYTVNLQKCKLQLKPEVLPMFADIFSGYVTLWRSFNDHETSQETFLVFNEQKMVFNETSGIVQLSREFQIWFNNSATITTSVYTPDLSHIIDTYVHQCSLCTEVQTGDMDFHAPENEPELLIRYDDILTAFENGNFVTFSAILFLCNGGDQHSFSTCGGHVPNFEMTADNVTLRSFSSSIQQTVHFDISSRQQVIDAINMNIYNNRSIEITDTRCKPPYYDVLHKFVSMCIMYTGMPGGTVHIFSN